MVQEIVKSDRTLLTLLRDQGSLPVLGLCEAMSITATAVRQKLDRLVAANLIARTELRKGRGRPGFEYSITASGLRMLGDNQADLASVLWRKLLSISDPSLRSRLMDEVSAELAGETIGEGGLVNAENLLQSKTEASSTGTENETGALSLGEVERRLDAVAGQLRSRMMPVSLARESVGGLPVLRFSACPYPDLSAIGHEICEMETGMLTRMAEMPMRLADCRCHATDGTCTFVPDIRLEGAVGTR